MKLKELAMAPSALTLSCKFLLDLVQLASIFVQIALGHPLKSAGVVRRASFELSFGRITLFFIGVFP
jgi:hypothetical protein